MNNKIENNQNEKSKILPILSLVVSATLFGVVTFHYFQAQSLQPFLKKVSLSSVNTMSIFDIHNSYENEKGISKNHLAKTISYLDYLPNDSKRTALLLTIGQTQIFAMQNTNKIAENYLLEQVIINSENQPMEKMRNIETHISYGKGDFNKEAFETYFNHLMKQYLSLKPTISMENGTYYQNKFIEQIKYTDELMDDKLERSLFSLRMTIDNRDNIKEIFSHNFDLVGFASEPEKTWEKSGFADKFGKDIPDYLNAYLVKGNIDKQVISDFINKYK